MPRAAAVMVASGSTFDYEAKFHHMEDEVTGPVVGADVADMLDISDVLPKHPGKHYPTRDPSIVTGYVVHHSGTKPQPWEIIARYHVNGKGWGGIAYHFGIFEGKILILNHINVLSNHTKNNNSRNVGVVVLGNYDSSDISEEDMKAIRRLDEYLRSIGITKMTWHSMHKPTACPGCNLVEFLKTLNKEQAS